MPTHRVSAIRPFSTSKTARPKETSRTAVASRRGRQGVRFAARAVSIPRVYSSRWCRTLETAENAFRDVEAEPIEALDIVDGDAAAHKADIIDIIKAFRGPGNQVLMTHPEVVEVLTGNLPRAGEAVIVAPSRDGGIDVVARLLLN